MAAPKTAFKHASYIDGAIYKGDTKVKDNPKLNDAPFGEYHSGKGFAILNRSYRRSV